LTSEYLATVERFYLVLRRQGLTLSAHDIRLVEQWQAATIPINVVCRALLDGAESFRSAQGDRRLPKTLHYFAEQVNNAAKRHEQTLVDHAEAPTEIAQSALTEELAELAWIGRKETCPRRRNAYRAAWRSLKTGSADSRSEALTTADAIAVDCFWDSLRLEEQAQIEASVEQQISPELNDLGAQGTQLRRRALLEDEICRHFGLVRLSNRLGRATHQKHGFQSNNKN
jgi:hypothetical protein